MKIIIVGAGIIGTNLAVSLSKENHEVFLIEVNEDVARKVDEKVDAKVFLGKGSDPAVLKGAGVEDADLVIAVTTSDETNLVVCNLATAFGAKRQIARVRDTALSASVHQLGCRQFGVDEIINPEEVAAQDIIKTIKTPGSREVADFADGRMLLRAFHVPETSPLSSMRIGELREEDFPWPFLIIALIRNSEVVIPSGSTVLEANDRIYVLLPSQSLGEFLTFVNPDIREARKIIVYGATTTAEHVVNGLAQDISDIILIEEDPDKSAEMASKLDNARIINGSASEADILKECGIEAADIFVATSLNDHSNLVSAVLAKKMGAQSAIIITQQPDYLTIINALNIDVIINPRLRAVDQILRLVRGKGIHTVTKLLESDCEAVEFVPDAGAPITRDPLRQIKFPKNSIVGAVTRGDHVFLANGDTVIEEGDKVIVFCQEQAVKKLQALFTTRKVF